MSNTNTKVSDVSVATIVDGIISLMNHIYDDAKPQEGPALRVIVSGYHASVSGLRRAGVDFSSVTNGETALHILDLMQGYLQEGDYDLLPLGRQNRRLSKWRSEIRKLKDELR